MRGRRWRGQLHTDANADAYTDPHADADTAAVERECVARSAHAE
jgi:hypothetical protein